MPIITAGRVEARIGGQAVTVHQGRTVLIPPGVSHELWNTRDEPAEGVLLMFGEGA